jgi:phytoene dehydrogenase-like protein
MLEFVVRMFATGDTCVPAKGMQKIPEQITSALPPDAIRLNAKVSEVSADSVRLESGQTLQAEFIVVATDGPGAAQLLPELASPASLGVTCLYFATEEPPIEAPILVLNGEGRGPVNNFHVASNVSSSYAPRDQALLSATVLGSPSEDDESLEVAVRSQLADWFGPVADEWRHLRTYRIPHAQPSQAPPALDPIRRPVQVRKRVYVCGDHRDTASINGAMVSGLRTAQAILEDNLDGSSMVA